MIDPGEAYEKSLRRTLQSKFLLWVILSLPAIGLLGRFVDGDLLYGEALHAAGVVSARLLLVTLAITPLRLFFPHATWPGWLLHRRRYFGVAAFLYAALHTAVYLHRKIGSGLVLEEATDFSMWTGWLALLMFLPLALTSNDASVRRLKRTWKNLHRWVYAAALLTFVHWIFAAFSFVAGLVHFIVLLVLESYRIWKRRRLKLSSAAAPQA